MFIQMKPKMSLTLKLETALQEAMVDPIWKRGQNESGSCVTIILLKVYPFLYCITDI